MKELPWAWQKPPFIQGLLAHGFPLVAEMAVWQYEPWKLEPQVHLTDCTWKYVADEHTPPLLHLFAKLEHVRILLELHALQLLGQ